MTINEIAKLFVIIPLCLLGVYAVARIISFAYFKSRTDYILGMIKIREKFFDEIFKHEILGGDRNGEEI